MKRAAIIGASKDSIHTIKVAKDKGLYVYAIDGSPQSEGFVEANEAFVCDISDVEKTKETVKKIKPDFILTVPIGRYLYTTACMNEYFNLKGIKKKFTEISVDKYEFHQFLNKNNLRDIRAYLIKPYEKIESGYDVCFPAIIKPRYGSGCRDVNYVENNDELENVFERIKKCREDFILEEVVEGDEYGVDAAVVDGKAYIILVRKKILVPLPQKQSVGSIALSPNIDADKKIIELVANRLQEIFDVMEYNDCIVNADIIINNDRVFVIETSPRPSGHYLHDVFVPFVSGIDIAGEYINYLMGEKYNFEPIYNKKAIIRFFDLEDKVIRYIPKIKEIKNSIDCKLAEWKCNIKENELMSKVTDGHSIIGRGYFILEGENDTQMRADSDKVLRMFL